MLLEYDDVANDQRTVIYQQRNELMEAEDIADSISGIREEVVTNLIDEHIPPQSMEEQWDVPGLMHALEREFGAQLEISKWLEEDTALDEAALRERILAAVSDEYDAKAAAVGNDLMRLIEKEYMLKFLDMHWREHLAALDYLRQGIGLRSYAQKNPRQEYKREAFEMFGTMLDRVKHELISFLSRVKVRGEEDVQAAQQRTGTDQMQYQHAEASALAAAPPPPAPAAAVASGQVPAAAGGAAAAACAAASGTGSGHAVRARCAETRPQRALLLRFGQEIQTLPRQARLGLAGPRPAINRLPSMWRQVS